MKLIENIDQVAIENWRHYLHAHPELSFEEVETAKYIEKVLQSFPHITTEKLTPTSVVAYLKGAHPGQTIALRADIDALPVDEMAEIDFVSENDGIMHACGHDSHAAMLLGAAQYLSSIQGQLHGTVKFIFQHAEELPPGGAIELVAEGVLDDVDKIFGLHVMTQMPVGKVAVGSGYVMASSDLATIKIIGKGAHGSMPEASIDPIIVGMEIINNLNKIVSRNVSPFANVVISIGEFTAGKTANVIPDSAKIQASIRTNEPEMRQYIKERIETVIKCVCEMYGATYELDYLLGYSPLKNEESATEIARTAISKVIGVENIVPMNPVMGSEDFSAYTEKCPATFCFIGAGVAEDGCGYIPHHPMFKINEDVLSYGAAIHAQIIHDLLVPIN